MPKFGDIARFTKTNLNGPVTVREPEPEPKREPLMPLILGILDAEPGLSALEISKRLKMDQGKVAGALLGYVTNGRIKRQKLDARYRYYPKSYKFASDREKQVCPFCSFDTMSKLALDAHIDNKHTQGPITELLPTTLDEHLQIAEVVEVKDPTTCPDCGRSFGTIQSMRLHQSIHAPESERTCPDCGRVMKHKAALARHISRGHAQEKKYVDMRQPVPCKVCGVKLTRWGMGTHMKYKHPVEFGDQAPVMTGKVEHDVEVQMALYYFETQGQGDLAGFAKWRKEKGYGSD